MDYGKLDPALAAALSRSAAAAPPTLAVFVHVDPEASAAQHAALRKLGLPRGSLQGGIATANLSPDQVRKLAEEPSVRRIRLSSRLNLLGDD